MWCRNYYWFGSVAALLTSASIQAQPPTLDSMFVFEQERGRIVVTEELPGGDVLVGGVFWVEDRFQWQIRRMTPDREFAWATTVMEDSFDNIASLTVSNEDVLLLGHRIIQIDSTSYTTDGIAICFNHDGDSLWSNYLLDGTNFTSISSAAALADGGFLVLGGVSRIDGIHVTWDTRLAKLSATGDVVWNRYYGGDGTDWSTNIVQVSQDTLLFGVSSRLGPQRTLTLLWVDTEGDTLRHVATSVAGNLFTDGSAKLFVSPYGIDVTWRSASFGNWDEQWRLLRFSNEGDLLLDATTLASRDMYVCFVPREDGMLVVGNTVYWDDTQDLIWGRFGQNGTWHYLLPTALPDTQRVYTIDTHADGRITAIGTQLDSDLILQPAFYYFSAEGRGSYLYSQPAGLSFGVVPLEEVSVREIQIHLTGDSAATITSLVFPDEYAIDFETPLPVTPGDSLVVHVAFRPHERRLYRDTLFVRSTALDSVLAISLSGEAPFPVCEPDTNYVDFRWAVVHDTVSKNLIVRNKGTVPLHIESVEDPLPFWIGNPGPHTVDVGDSVTFQIFFAAVEEGVIMRPMFLHSDDPATPDTVRMMCRALEVPSSGKEQPELPREFKLHAAYPNPFNSTAVLSFDLPKMVPVKLNLFDITGRLAKEIAPVNYAAGEHRIVIDGTGLASGIYFANLNAGEFHAVQKLVLLK